MGNHARVHGRAAHLEQRVHDGPAHPLSGWHLVVERVSRRNTGWEALSSGELLRANDGRATGGIDRGLSPRLMTLDTREFFDRWIKAMNDVDVVALEGMLHPDFVAEYPQSGERIRGYGAFRQMLELYPGGLPTDGVRDSQIVDGDERWAMSPGYTVVPLSAPNRYTTTVRIAYPDGSFWRTVTLVELREDKVYRLESYFAPELPAPLVESVASFPRG